MRRDLPLWKMNHDGLVRMRVVRKQTEKDMAAAALDLYAAECLSVVESGRDFIVALSGGGTPLGFFGLLAVDARIYPSAWKKTHVFWVDERCVSTDDPESNYGNAKRVLLDHVPIKRDNIHRMPSELSPEEGANFYQEALITFFGCERGEIPRFDLVLLGVGSDGHVASLFPGSDLQPEDGRLVRAVKGGEPDVWRITLTLPVLNAAEHVMILASERKKAPVVQALLGKSAWVPVARLVRPKSGNLTLVIDEAAAGELENRGFEGHPAREEDFSENEAR
jgi:6-phosphogluconolactonase